VLKRHACCRHAGQLGLNGVFTDIEGFDSWKQIRISSSPPRHRRFEVYLFSHPIRIQVYLTHVTGSFFKRRELPIQEINLSPFIKADFLHRQHKISPNGLCSEPDKFNAHLYVLFLGSP
jgi:hypothetical protein